MLRTVPFGLPSRSLHSFWFYVSLLSVPRSRLEAGSCVCKLLLLLVAWFGPPIRPMVSKTCAPLPPRDISLADKYHYILINPGSAVSSVAFTFAWCLPTIVVAGIGVSHVNANYPNLDAGMGTGVVW